MLSLLLTGGFGFLVSISFRAVGLNILRFTTFVPILGGVVAEGHNMFMNFKNKV